MAVPASSRGPAARMNTAECRALRAEGWTLDQLGARYGVSRSRVCFVCRGVVCPIDHNKRHGAVLARRKIDEADARRLRIRAMYAAGHVPKVIAHALGLSIGTVYRHLPPLNSPLARKLREVA